MQYQSFKTKKKLKKKIIIEKKIVFLKNILHNLYIPNYIKQMAGFKLFKVCNSSIKNRCLITNKSRSVSSYFKLSRIKLRWLISNGYINSVKKTNY
jgi:ribosomal protein S14